MPDRRTPDDVRVAVRQALTRAFPDGADTWEAPHDLAVQLALREGLTAEEALARCGVQVPPPGPMRVPFGRLPHGAPFRLGGIRYRKVTARASRDLTAGAPNALPIDDGRPLWLAPDHVVERVPTVVAPVRRTG